jgi:hypothetical protein
MKIKPYIKYTITVPNADGTLDVVEHPEMPCHSFLSNFANLFRAFARWGSFSVKNTAGGALSASMYSEYSRNSGTGIGMTMRAVNRVNSAAGDTNYGIVVGTNGTPDVPSDYALKALIRHGTSPGTCEYEATLVSGVSVVGNVSSFEVSRVVQNNSGGDITIREIGLVASNSTYGRNASYIMMLRDVFPDGVSLPSGASAEFKFIFRTVT